MHEGQLKALMCCKEGRMTASKQPGELQRQPSHPKTWK